MSRDAFSEMAELDRAAARTGVRVMAGPGPRVIRAFVALGLAGMIALTGCWQTDSRFESEATYRAPRNGLLLQGEASGLVPAGWDVSRDYRGRFRLRPEDDEAAGVELLLSSEHPKKLRIAGSYRMLQWSSSTDAASLQTALEEAGIPVLAPEELEEVAYVMRGLLAGPKGTTMKGQADQLEVVEVRTDYLD